jgi:hypothetical protein
MSGDRKPLVKLTEVWERTSANGNRYFSGYLGASQFFEDGKHPHPTRPGETVHVWKVPLQERDQPTQPTRNAERGQRTWDRSRDAQRYGERSREQAAGEAVLAAAGRDFAGAGNSSCRENPEPPAGFTTTPTPRCAISNMGGR